MDNPSLAKAIAQEQKLKPAQVSAVLDMLAEGATIPFIARYRKDKTDNLDETQIVAIKEQAEQIREFEHRKAFIEKAITEQGKMTDWLQQQLNACATVAQLEDLYLPYKPKRKTKAQQAREKGLQPLADLILAQQTNDWEAASADYLNEAVPTVELALQGARDIVAETVNEDAAVREKMRSLFEREADLRCQVMTGKEEEGAKFKDYFDYRERASHVPSHRGLAVLRGFSEGFLRMSIEPEETTALPLLEDMVITNRRMAQPHLEKAIKDAYRRLIQPSMESESRMQLKQRCDEEAIAVFADNLRQLLLSSPLGGKRLLALDPGYRTGCKTVLLDAQGNLLFHSVVYLHQEQKAVADLQAWIRQYQPDAVAIGDGTAGRETEKLIKQLQTGLPVFLVNEDGASIYSASEVAREEFPTEDITVRGAVSIGRRLMDPLAELVKIDPKSIGVGQYQHDVNQVRLKEKLDQTVESCVNQVGVNVNTASYNLLQYVSGIGDTIAKNIVAYRKEHGAFASREQLKKVPRLGEKAFEQCAGFLRIPAASNPLDASAVHPEQYPVVERMAKELGKSVMELIGNDALVQSIDMKAYTALAGEHTLRDILKELKKPGTDPRKPVSTFSFADIYSLDDVQAGMIVPGKVTNLTRFGAFVDIGVKQDGLVHISEITNRFISDPGEVLKLGDEVQVMVVEVDHSRKRIALSIRQAQPNQQGGGKAIRPARMPEKKAPEAPKSFDDALAGLRTKFRR